MNTVVKFTNPATTIVTKDDKILNRGVAWVFTQDRKCTSEEIRMCQNGWVYKRVDPLNKKVYFDQEIGRYCIRKGKFRFRLISSDCSLWIAVGATALCSVCEEVTDLVDQGFVRIFWIRSQDPASSSLSLDIGRGNEPIRVQREETLVKSRSRKTNNKHVHQPHSSK